MNLQELTQQEAAKQRIYTEKRKGRDCYDTRMLYEINDEREEAFEVGAGFMVEHIQKFADFVSRSKYILEKGLWVNHDLKIAYTAEQLFNLYLQTLQPK